MPEQGSKTSGLNDALLTFVNQIDSLRDTLPLAMLAIQAAHQMAHKRYDEFVAKNCQVEERDGTKFAIIPPDHYLKYSALKKRLEKTDLAYENVPKSFVVALVSQYDALVGKLYGFLLRERPEILKSSDRPLTFSQLSEFGSIENAKDYLVEKEVETLLRKSHADQFKFLGEQFEIPLKKDLPIWSRFIEVTERRNLFVHADGVVSNQYLKVCSDHGAEIPAEVRPGSRLDVSFDYFKEAHEAIFEIGVKLTQVLWRKVLPQQLEDADSALLDVGYELLEEKKYGLAKLIYDFACCTLKKHFDERKQLLFVVNRAQAYKWAGDEEEAQKILATEDWSAKDSAFRLAKEVLVGNFEEAAALMRKIGSDGYPIKGHYRTWPLFQEFRKSEPFKAAFKEIFGEADDVITQPELSKQAETPTEGPEGTGTPKKTDLADDDASEPTIQ